MYETLQESFPTHGLEIVFVSSDRDANSFRNYYSKMPWTAIPFESLSLFKANLSMRYGVRGIPSFVIIDAVSGQTVVPGSASRREVMEACQRGDVAIENLFRDWLQRVPADTIEMMSMLELSCMEDQIETKDSTEEEVTANYLVQPSSASPTPVAFEPAPMLTRDDWEQVCLNRVLQHASSSDLAQVVATALKYLENARKQPWVAKFRSFRLSNKVADRITRVPHGITFLQSLGVEVYPTDSDFIVSFPLALDLDALQEDLEAYQEEYST